MGATICSPTITVNDFEAFRRLVNKDFPDTYDKWLNLARQKGDKFAEVGNAIEDIEVKPDEFARFLRSTGASPDTQSLWTFAHEKCCGRIY